MDKAKLLKRYNEYTEINNHNEAAMILIKAFGTQEEADKLRSIMNEHERQGYMSMEQRREVFELSNKYYKLLKY